MSGVDVIADNRVARVARDLAGRGALGVAPYVTAGDGGLARTQRLLEALEEGGAACCELGVPFTDPIADGPVLQRAAERALAGGTSLDGIAEAVRAFRAGGGELPILLFSYLNPLLAGGLERRLHGLREAGVDGVLSPDLPAEEAEHAAALARDAGLVLPLFAAPTSSETRIRAAAALSTGFLYVVGRVGVTGARTEVGVSQRDALARVRAFAGEAPLGVGFGIAERAQVAALRGAAELAISGTAFVRAIHGDGGEDDGAAVRRAAALLEDLRAGAAGAGPHTRR